jgi:hypothetical protein
MEEELILQREAYKTVARKNLAIEHFWQQQAIAHGFEPFVPPPELMELSRLSAMEYTPDLGDLPEERHWLIFCQIYHCSNIKKRECPELFCFRFFSLIIFHQATENNFWVIFDYFQKFVEIFSCQGSPPKQPLWYTQGLGETDA